MSYEIPIIIAVVFVFYARIINYLLVVDDLSRLQDHLKLRELPSFRNTPFVACIKYWTYGFGTLGVDTTSEETKRQSIRKDHALTIAMHALTCVLIYQALGANTISFWAAILYAINPINHQTAIWSNGRRYALCTILVLVMLILPKPFGLAAWALTPVFQVTAIFAPVLLGWKYAALSLLAIALGWKRFKGAYAARVATQGSDEMRVWKPIRLMVTVKLYGFYFFRSIIPGRVMMVYPHLYFWGLTQAATDEAHKANWNFFRGATAVTLTLLGLYLLHGQERLYLLFAAMATLQWCGFLVVNQHSCDRYIAIANVFTMYLLSYLLNTLLGNYAIPVLTAILACYATELNVLMPMYKSIIRFHDYHNYHYPSNVISRQSYVHGLMSERRPLEAWYEIQQALKYNPTDTRINFLAAQICLTMGSLELAIKHIAIAREHVYLGQAKFYEPQFVQLESQIVASKFRGKFHPNPAPVQKPKLASV